MAVTFKDLLHGHLISDVPINTQQKMEILKARLNKLQDIYKKPLIVTSGYRTAEDQQRINPRHPHSKHLTGQAADISDVTGEMKHWLLSNLDVLEECDLYCEAFEATPTWVHYQTEPPKSGKRIFNP